MLVKLREDWFAPGDVEVLDKANRNGEVVVVRSRSGQRFRKRDNPHNMPDEWKSILPKSATVIEKHQVVDEIEAPRNLRDFDELRMAAVEVDNKLEAARARAAAARAKIGKDK